jgi:hypothetical protein
MTQETTNEREAFEAWAKTKDFDLFRADSMAYNSMTTHLTWLGWQARSRVASACASAEPVCVGRYVTVRADGGNTVPLYAPPAAPAEVPQTNADSVHRALPPAAAVVEFPSRGWQSIDSAPKDGTVLLCLWHSPKSAVRVTSRNYGLAMFEYGRWCSPEDADTLYNEPDHWMPLPSPPSTAAASPEPDGIDSSAPPSLQAVDTGGVPPVEAPSMVGVGTDQIVPAQPTHGAPHLYGVKGPEHG